MPPEPLLPYHDPQLPIEQRVSDLLARMTLEEKLAQLSVSGQIDAVVDGQHSLDQLPEFAAHGVGAVSRLGLKQTPADTVLLYNKIQEYLVKQTRLGIPAFAIDEALHGLMAQGSTFFPQRSVWPVPGILSWCTTCLRPPRPRCARAAATMH